MGRLKICTWNIQLGSRIDAVLETIAEHRDFSGLDVLALQEASEHNGLPDARRVASRLGPAFSEHQFTSQIVGGQVQANALVWDGGRLCSTSPGVLRLPLMADPSGIRRFEAWLLQKLPAQQRGGVLVDGRLGDEMVRIYSVHFDVIGVGHRLRQLAAVLADNAMRPAVSVCVIAGDLNTFGLRRRPAWSALAASLSAARFQDVTRELPWTHTTRRLRLRQKLDAVLVSQRPGLSHRAWTVATNASDHLPVFVELQWG